MPRGAGLAPHSRPSGSVWWPATRTVRTGRHFRTTQPTDPDSPELRSFAASVGADYVVWSKHVVGKVETVEREPVQSNRWRTSRVWDADRKRYDYERRWGPETVWVPVVVEREQVRWVVFYLRQR